MEDHMVDLYYYFKSSSNFSIWNGMVLGSTSQRISLENCVEKELKYYPILKFLSRNPDNALINDGIQEEDHINKSCKARSKRLKKAFSDPLTEVHVSFYPDALPLFTQYNQFPQRSDPLAHLVKPVTYNLTRKIGMRFLISDVLDGVTEEVLKNKDNYLPWSSDYIGGRGRRGMGGGGLRPYCKIYLRKVI